MPGDAAPPTGSPEFRGLPVPLRTAVLEASWLGPRMRRLRLAGGDLDRWRWSGAAANCKLIVPAPGHGPESLPASGRALRLDRSALTVRTYTPRAFDPAPPALTVEVFVHPRGPMAAWAAAAGPGAELAVTTSLGGYVVERDARWLLLAGDESALPAIATIVDHLPPGAPRPAVVVEVGADDDRLDLGDVPSRVTWVLRGDAPAGERLAAAVRAETPDADGGAVWVACEAGAMLEIRRFLLEERGLPRRAVATRGYWKLGAREVDPPAG